MVTSPKIIFMVVASLVTIVIAGMGAIVYLILQNIDAAMIATVTGPTLTALGALISLLNNTRTQAAPAANPPNPAPINGANPQPVVVTNAPSDPVPTIEKP